ncbi:MAG: glycosyltransferase family 39 protein [Erysipelotrichaceae bacterium]
MYSGMHIDEAGIIYDAYTLANYHIDRYLNPFPVYMINFGGGQSALYTYLVALLFKIFNPSLFVARLPIVIFNVLFSIFFALIIKKMHGKRFSILSLVLIMILPYFVMQSRFSLDCNLLVCFMAVDTYFLILAFEKRNKLYFFLTGILFGLTLYTYILAWLILPLYFLLILIYLSRIKLLKLTQLSYFISPIIIFAIPLIVTLIINLFDFNQITLGNLVTIPKLFNWRGSEVSVFNIYENFKLLTSSLLFDNYNYNSDPQFGTVYYCFIPLVLIGIFVGTAKFIKDSKAKQLGINTLMFFGFISSVIIFLLVVDLNISKMNILYLYYAYFIVLGLVSIYSKTKLVFTLFLSAGLISSFCFFVHFFEPVNLDKRLFLFNNDIAKVIETIKFDNPDIPIYVDSDDEKEFAWYIANKLPNPYLIDYKARKIDNIFFSPLEEISPYGVYIITESYEFSDMLYDFIKKNGTGYMKNIEGYLVYYIW